MQRRDPNILSHPGLQPLWDGLQAEWRQQQITAVGLLLVGIGMMVVAQQRSSPIWFGSGSGCILFALIWLFRLAERKPVSEVYHLLLEEAEDVAWVYGEVTERLPFGLRFSKMATLYLIMKDGEEISVGLAPDKMKLVTKTLNRVLPSAEFGYSAEREMKYRGEVLRRRRPDIDR